MNENDFWKHLDVLRTCLIRTFIGLGVGIAVAFIVVQRLFKILTIPYYSYLETAGFGTSTALNSLSPADTFNISMKLAISAGLGLASPWVFYQLWNFVAPALYKKEKKYAAVFCVWTTVFFIAGATFAYLVALPTAIGFFHGYSLDLGITPIWNIKSYFEFIMFFIIGFGVVFELPVVIAVLSWFGIVTPSFLSSHRRHAVVLIFIVAAIFTPPDVVSQMMMAIPMVVLYEASILASKIIAK